ncbi:MAG: hypothetical protein IJ867_02065 [Clostridia bacterium]|nr:hypothetical protein [Clostridia bacterium]
MNLLELKCRNCGATLEVDSGLDKVYCKYCGTENLIDDKATELKRMEDARLKARQENHEQDLKERQDILDQELKEKREKEKAEAAIKFRKGKSSKFLIVFIIICVIFTVGRFEVGSILSGLVGIVQIVVLSWAWLSGMQIVKEKFNYMHTVLTIIGIILVIPFLRLDTVKLRSSSKDKPTSSNIEIPSSIVTPKEEVVENNNDENTDNSGLSAEFKKAMDSYEKFMEEYISFMKRYAVNPSDISLLTEYSNYLEKYNQMIEDFEKWDSEDLNDAEMAYYIEVQTRVSQKLSKASLAY